VVDGITASSLLALWDHGQRADTTQRALTLLCEAWPQFDRDAWARLPIGRRDLWLVALQESLFGDTIDALADCPACGEALETCFSTAEIRATPADAGDDDGEAAWHWHWGGYTLDVRLPTSGDLLSVVDEAGRDDGGHGDDAAADGARVTGLLLRCVGSVRCEGDEVSVQSLPPGLVDALQAEMARRDPGADPRIGLVCAACGHRFESRFDIVGHLWSEIDEWARRTLREVHRLASAYGWTEREILGLSAARRRHYIELVSA